MNYERCVSCCLSPQHNASALVGSAFRATDRCAAQHVFCCSSGDPTAMGTARSVSSMSTGPQTAGCDACELCCWRGCVAISRETPLHLYRHLPVQPPSAVLQAGERALAQRV